MMEMDRLVVVLDGSEDQTLVIESKNSHATMKDEGDDLKQYVMFSHYLDLERNVRKSHLFECEGGFYGKFVLAHGNFLRTPVQFSPCSRN